MVAVLRLIVFLIPQTFSSEFGFACFFILRALQKVRADSMESDVSDWNSSPVDARRGLSAVASAPSPLARSRKGQNQTGKARRVRRPWTEEQVDALKQGVKEFGVGQWRQIAERYFDKSTIKSGRDLKDKWRNLKLAKKTED
eukprot:m.113639 g.113639  ORF g.113639 m.113639 type:complete len:142 (+) comp17092_c0_seq2:1636-2061(+)